MAMDVIQVAYMQLSDPLKGGYRSRQKLVYILVSNLFEKNYPKFLKIDLVPIWLLWTTAALNGAYMIFFFHVFRGFLLGQ